MRSPAYSMFETVIVTLKSASQAKETSIMDRFFNENGFKSAEVTDPRFEDGFQWSHENDAVYVQYRSFDPSQVFSIQNDINVYRIKLILGGVIAKDEERRFSD